MTLPRWSIAELERDAEVAKAVFRRERLQEPRQSYSAFYSAFAPVVAETIDRLPRLLREDMDTDAWADQLRDDDRRTALRYVGAPPISADDLEILAETSLAPSVLQRDQSRLQRVRQVVTQIIDPHRFPWIVEHRERTASEYSAAVEATAALIAARKVETLRRSTASASQEQEVKVALREAGFNEVAARDIPILDAAPRAGEFCGESKLAETRADLVVRLRDGRLLAIECKASNSTVNSYKRINHEAVDKARKWLEAFGQRQTVPAAAISGVFNPVNLHEAQEAGLALIWSHRLTDLSRFLDADDALAESRNT